MSFTSKAFDEQIFYVCPFCNCSCNLIIYKKDSKVVDVVGNPKDKIGMGSVCTKGISYIRELSYSDFRLKEENSALPKLSKDDAIFLDHTSTFDEIAFALSYTENVFSDLIFVRKDGNISFENLLDKDIIILVGSEPTHNDVMLTRWIVNAREKGAKLFYIHRRHTSLASKSQFKNIVYPGGEALFLIYLAKELNLIDIEIDIDILKSYNVNIELVHKLKHFIPKLNTALVISDVLYRTAFGNYIDYLLKLFEENLKLSFIVHGKISTLPLKNLKTLKQNLRSFDKIISFGNLFRLLDGKEINAIKDKTFVFSYFPDKTVNEAKFYFPRSMAPERDFYKESSVFGKVSSKALKEKIGYSLIDLIEKKNNKIFNIEEKPFDLKAIEPYKSSIFTDYTVLEELGRWSKLLIDIEKYQFLYINPKDMEKMSIKNMDKVVLEIKEKKFIFRAQESFNVLPNSFFVPNFFDEYQPFYEGYSFGSIFDENWDTRNFLIYKA